MIRAEDADGALKTLLAHKSALSQWWTKAFEHDREHLWAHPVFGRQADVPHLRNDDVLFAVWLVRACRSLTSGEKGRLTRLYNKLISVSEQVIAAKRQEAENCNVPKVRGGMMAVIDLMTAERRYLLSSI
jgi:hypothetical protein